MKIDTGDLLTNIAYLRDMYPEFEITFTIRLKQLKELPAQFTKAVETALSEASDKAESTVTTIIHNMAENVTPEPELPKKKETEKVDIVDKYSKELAESHAMDDGYKAVSGYTIIFDRKRDLFNDTPTAVVRIIESIKCAIENSPHDAQYWRNRTFRSVVIGGALEGFVPQAPHYDLYKPEIGTLDNSPQGSKRASKNDSSLHKALLSFFSGAHQVANWQTFRPEVEMLNNNGGEEIVIMDQKSKEVYEKMLQKNPKAAKFYKELINQDFVFYDDFRNSKQHGNFVPNPPSAPIVPSSVMR